MGSTGPADDAAAAREAGLHSDRAKASKTACEKTVGHPRDVGGGRDDEGAFAAIKVAEGSAVEQNLVV